MKKNAQDDSWLSCFKGRTDLQQFDDNSYGLFALALFFRIDDICSIATDIVTDGSGDKKCDIIYTNRDDRYAVIAQCYASSRPEKGGEAKANKASDLSIAAGWLFNREINELPDTIKPAATELRSAVKEGGLIKYMFGTFIT